MLRNFLFPTLLLAKLQKIRDQGTCCTIAFSTATHGYLADASEVPLVNLGADSKGMDAKKGSVLFA